MKRISTSLALVALGLTGCKGNTAVDPAKLVPEAATVMGGVNVKGLMTSKAYAESKDALEQGEAKEFLAAAKACKLDPAGFDGVTFGVDPMSENAVVVIAAKGIAKTETLDCVAGKIKEKSGQDPWTVEDKDGAKTLNIDNGEGVGYLIGDNTIAIASKAWAPTVKELIAGKGKSAADGKLKDLVARAPKNNQIWFAGTIPAEAKGELKGSPAEQLQNVSGGLDLTNGLAISVAAGVADAKGATALQAELQKQFEGAKMMGQAMGVPKSVIDSVKIGAAESTVTLALAASDGDLKTIREKVQGMMGGLVQPPAGPPTAPAIAAPPEAEDEAADPAAAKPE